MHDNQSDGFLDVRTQKNPLIINCHLEEPDGVNGCTLLEMPNNVKEIDNNATYIISVKTQEYNEIKNSNYLLGLHSFNNEEILKQINKLGKKKIQ